MEKRIKLEEDKNLIELQAMLYTSDAIFKALSDGYNHAYLGLKFGENLKETEYLIWDIHLSRSDDEYIEYINEAKTKIDNVETRIRENIFWSLEHLRIFNKIPLVFANQYNLKFLEGLLEEIVEKLKAIIVNWNSIVYEYDIYIGERRVLVIEDDNKVIVLDIFNSLH